MEERIVTHFVKVSPAWCEAVVCFLARGGIFAIFACEKEITPPPPLLAVTLDHLCEVKNLYSAEKE